jgi:S-adenosylmethionine decarboxylase
MTLGLHQLLELNGCPFDVLNDEAAVRVALRDAADAAGATWLGEVSHAFEPAGVTALGLLAQSHISIHTWPEIGYAAVDVFTCGDPTMPEAACNHLIRTLRSSTHSLVRVPRTIGPTHGAKTDPNPDPNPDPMHGPAGEQQPN